MTSRNTPKRRLALKLLGGSALTGALADKLPAVWQRPIVNNSLLPAHAQTSVADDSPGISGGLRRLSVGGSQYTLYGDIATTGIQTDMVLSRRRKQRQLWL